MGLEADQRQMVIDESRSWLRTPFRMNANVKGAGVDCGRFLVSVYGAAGLAVPEELDHWPVDWAHHALAAADPYVKIILDYTSEITNPKPGDFCLTRMGRAFSHSAIIIDLPVIIHCTEAHGVVYGNITQYPFERRPIRYFTFWGK
jgi:cell wall-associated NlpC family hydrolase